MINKMMNIIHLFQKNIIYLFIFIFLIDSVSSYLAFKFPYAFKLNNKNIFVIHQLGVTLCDDTFTESIDRVITFSESEKIKTDEALSKVTSVIANDYVICLINDRIYIFDEDGYLLKKNDILITELNVEYYSLIFIEKTIGYLSFVIGFINSQKLYLHSYKYQFSDNKVVECDLSEITNLHIKNNGLSCQYMYYKYESSWFWGDDYDYYIACLYHSSEEKKGIANEIIKIENTKFVSYETKNTIFNTDYSHEIKYIKTALLPGDESLLVGWLNSEGVPSFYKYNINDGSGSSDATHYFAESYCKFIPHGFKVDYFPEKRGIIYTCIFERDNWTDVENANILVESLNVNAQQTNYTFKYNNCNLNGYSIIYLDVKGEYYIISDVECSNKLIPMNLLFGNLKEEEISVHTEDFKDEAKMIEIETEKEKNQFEEEFIEEYEISMENNVLEFFEEEKNDIKVEETYISYNNDEEEILKILIYEKEKEYYEKEENININEKEIIKENEKLKEEEKV